MAPSRHHAMRPEHAGAGDRCEKQSSQSGGDTCLIKIRDSKQPLCPSSSASGCSHGMVLSLC